MDIKLTAEMRKAAESTESVDALLALAKANGFDITLEQAKEIFSDTHPSGEISDDELDNVAGGGCSGHKCSKCGRSQIQKYLTPGGGVYVWACPNCDK